MAVPAEEFDFHAKLMTILSNAVEAMGGSAGVIALWNEREKRFVEEVSHGLEPRAVDKLRPLPREAIPALVASSQSFDRLSRFAPGLHVPATTAEQVQDPIVVQPLVIAGKTIGLICVLRPSLAESFDNRDQCLLSAFADQVSILVQNARLASQLAEEHLDLSKGAHKVSKRFSGLSKIHKVEVNFLLELPPVPADPEKIGRVLINLIENAVKFSPWGGTITISGETSENEVLVTIAESAL